MIVIGKQLDYAGEVGIALLVVAVISLMILPLPTFAIDTLLAINIAISVVLLTVTMYIPNALHLSSFPSLLLFTTLFRLSLNIASTKSILLHAEAGHIIDSFGQLVVGGNLVVGLVVFLIIATVQFIVIAKGSERVAEVSARFTLDALPGKQMSIDADVRAGTLTAEEARHKRSLLAMESQLHGGMDGAMKFVKGDAIAGLVITVVNILAGIVVGISYHGMTAGEAANRFSVLSVGDAMVSQIPSLLISVAAGIIITRVSDEHQKKPASLGFEIGKQLVGNSRALFAASALLIGFALVPGFPSTLFVLLASIIGFAAFQVRRTRRGKAEAAAQEIPALQREGAKGDIPGINENAPAFASPLAVRMAPDLVSRINADKLNKAIAAERQVFTEEIGLPFPGVAMWKSPTLADNEYDILLLDVPTTSGLLPPNKVMLKNPSETHLQHAEHIAYSCGHEMGYWVEQSNSVAQIEAGNYTSEELIAHHIVVQLRKHMHLFMGVQEAQWIMDRINSEYPSLIAEAQKALPVQRIAEVLRRLLEEQVPIRNIKTILESVIAWGPKEKDLLLLTEYVRSDLGRFLAHRATGGTGQLKVVTLDLPVEQTIRQSIKQTPAGNFLTLPPDQAQALIDQLSALVKGHPQGCVSGAIAVISSMDIRRYFRRMIENHLPMLQVYSFQELSSHADLKPVGRLSL
ncbi:type III secretion system export apparatus subunit SctV [Uliginosibacterium gangwonense]|uniref:type III secretion system export apparatus subunit SctV n=1 Tax=Uliginosibacterium gangwonense TaxID=392736 RepID=UPI00035FD6F3|nr:type III secretion system export apparatus subunit SctV [Uliginosibacterium gangwonense]